MSPDSSSTRTASCPRTPWLCLRGSCGPGTSCTLSRGAPLRQRLLLARPVSAQHLGGAALSHR
eukprot:5084062-Alexandrium_andersonii.AAC.1